MATKEFAEKLARGESTKTRETALGDSKAAVSDSRTALSDTRTANSDSRTAVSDSRSALANRRTAPADCRKIFVGCARDPWPATTAMEHGKTRKRTYTILYFEAIWK